MIKVINKDDASELAGRMYECIEINKFINDGQFKTLDDIAKYTTESASAIGTAIKAYHADVKNIEPVSSDSKDTSQAELTDKEGFLKLIALRRVIDAAIAKYGEETRVTVYSHYEGQGAFTHKIVSVNMGDEANPRLDIEVGSGEVSKVFAPDACLTGICKDCHCSIEFGEDQCFTCSPDYQKYEEMEEINNSNREFDEA